MSSTPHRSIDIDANRLWDSLMQMAEVGPSPNGGSRRLAMTPEDADGRRLLLDWVEALGCTWQRDKAGNLFIRRAGREDHLPPVSMGSHLDTQPLGGRFDGVLGVLAGLEVLRSLHDNAITTRRPLSLIVWTNEEGSRFAPAMGGSGVWTGRLDEATFFGASDSKGVTLGEAIAACGEAGDLPLGEPELDAYFELHIEQGPVLEEQGHPLGIVTGVQGIRWYDLSLRGQSAHAGPTPMSYRRDPLLAATAMIQRMREVVMADPDGAARLTVGDFQVVEPSRNVVPGEVRLLLDLRHVSDERLDALDAELERLARDAADVEGVELTFERRWHSPVTPFDDALIDSLREAVKARELDAPCMMSGAGHDAVHLSHVTPTVMIFVPCRDGISHNEAEYAEPEHCALGTQLLCDAVLARAERD
ncbi:M20 family metallo-hydrolase [Halomonas sp. DP5N14-9]|uniref:M20 family metallo-hydrolase n=1 Tax=Halomonas sp. H10-59 TaxID=2950874 RepID=A0AAU7KYR0_9GAMM|nr:M20 family metallo-hydrolase [Halomonas sp. DP5N14-9]MBY5942047.1 M20 family metallo-hydrolase [Halomonas sp. DP5N14-9]